MWIVTVVVILCVVFKPIHPSAYLQRIEEWILMWSFPYILWRTWPRYLLLNPISFLIATPCHGNGSYCWRKASRPNLLVISSLQPRRTSLLARRLWHRPCRWYLSQWVRGVVRRDKGKMYPQYPRFPETILRLLKSKLWEKIAVVAWKRKYVQMLFKPLF